MKALEPMNQNNFKPAEHDLNKKSDKTKRERLRSLKSQIENLRCPSRQRQQGEIPTHQNPTFLTAIFIPPTILSQYIKKKREKKGNFLRLHNNKSKPIGRFLKQPTTNQIKKKNQEPKTIKDYL